MRPRGVMLRVALLLLWARQSFAVVTVESVDTSEQVVGAQTVFTFTCSGDPLDADTNEPWIKVTLSGADQGGAAVSGWRATESDASTTVGRKCERFSDTECTVTSTSFATEGSTGNLIWYAASSVSAVYAAVGTSTQATVETFGPVQIATVNINTQVAGILTTYTFDLVPGAQLDSQGTNQPRIKVVAPLAENDADAVSGWGTGTDGVYCVYISAMTCKVDSTSAADASVEGQKFYYSAGTTPYAAFVTAAATNAVTHGAIHVASVDIASQNAGELTTYTFTVTAASSILAASGSNAPYIKVTAPGTSIGTSIGVAPWVDGTNALHGVPCVYIDATTCKVDSTSTALVPEADQKFWFAPTQGGVYAVFTAAATVNAVVFSQQVAVRSVDTSSQIVGVATTYNFTLNAALLGDGSNAPWIKMTGSNAAAAGVAPWRQSDAKPECGVQCVRATAMTCTVVSTAEVTAELSAQKFFYSTEQCGTYADFADGAVTNSITFAGRVGVASVDVNEQIAGVATVYTFTATASDGHLAPNGANKPYIKVVDSGATGAAEGVLGWREAGLPDDSGRPCVYATPTTCTVTSTATAPLPVVGQAFFFTPIQNDPFVVFTGGAATNMVTFGPVAVSTVDLSRQVSSMTTPYVFTVMNGDLATDGSNVPYIKVTAPADDVVEATVTLVGMNAEHFEANDVVRVDFVDFLKTAVQSLPDANGDALAADTATVAIISVTDTTVMPTSAPTNLPTNAPTALTNLPTSAPTTLPTNAPTALTNLPTSAPTTAPTAVTSAPTTAVGVRVKFAVSAPLVSAVELIFKLNTVLLSTTGSNSELVDTINNHNYPSSAPTSRRRRLQYADPGATMVTALEVTVAPAQRSPDGTASGVAPWVDGLIATAGVPCVYTTKTTCTVQSLSHAVTAVLWSPNSALQCCTVNSDSACCTSTDYVGGQDFHSAPTKEGVYVPFATRAKNQIFVSTATIASIVTTEMSANYANVLTFNTVDLALGNPVFVKIVAGDDCNAAALVGGQLTFVSAIVGTLSPPLLIANHTGVAAASVCSSYTMNGVYAAITGSGVPAIGTTIKVIAVPIVSVDIQSQVAGVLTTYTFTTPAHFALDSACQMCPFVKMVGLNDAPGPAGASGASEGAAPWAAALTTTNGVQCVFVTTQTCKIESTADYVAPLEGQMFLVSRTAAGTYVPPSGGVAPNAIVFGPVTVSELSTVHALPASGEVLCDGTDRAVGKCPDKSQVSGVATRYTFTVTGGNLDQSSANAPYIKVTAASASDGTATGVLPWANLQASAMGIRCIFATKLTCTLTTTSSAVTEAAGQKFWFAPDGAASSVYAPFTTPATNDVLISTATLIAVTSLNAYAGVTNTFSFTSGDDAGPTGPGVHGINPLFVRIVSGTDCTSAALAVADVVAAGSVDIFLSDKLTADPKYMCWCQTKGGTYVHATPRARLTTTPLSLGKVRSQRTGNQMALSGDRLIPIGTLQDPAHWLCWSTGLVTANPVAVCGVPTDATVTIGIDTHDLQACGRQGEMLALFHDSKQLQISTIECEWQSEVATKTSRPYTTRVEHTANEFAYDVTETITVAQYHSSDAVRTGLFREGYNPGGGEGWPYGAHVQGRGGRAEGEPKCSNKKLELCTEWIYCLEQPQQCTYLHIDDPTVYGTIPDGIDALTALQSLYLTNNKISGTFPANLAACTELTELHISDTQVSGTLPDSLGDLNNLKNELWLHNNKLTGSIPESINKLTFVERLTMGDNQLTGTIPQGVVELTELKSLHLQRNKISGTLPSGLDAFVKMTELALQHNDLSGTFPTSTSLKLPPILTSLNVHENELSGSLPANLGTLAPHLKHLRAGGNLISGALPDMAAWPTTLITLELRGNQISGTIPPTIKTLVNLELLAVGNNYLDLYVKYDKGVSGATVPARFEGESEAERIAATNVYAPTKYGLTGTLPAELGLLTNLAKLNLANNHLSGSLPEELGDMTALTGIALASNRISGSIPKEIGKLSILRSLDFGQNPITGADWSRNAAKDICDIAANLDRGCNLGSNYGSTFQYGESWRGDEVVNGAGHVIDPSGVPSYDGNNCPSCLNRPTPGTPASAANAATCDSLYSSIPYPCTGISLRDLTASGTDPSKCFGCDDTRRRRLADAPRSLAHTALLSLTPAPLTERHTIAGKYRSGGSGSAGDDEEAKRILDAVVGAPSVDNVKIVAVSAPPSRRRSDEL